MKYTDLFKKRGFWSKPKRIGLLAVLLTAVLAISPVMNTWASIVEDAKDKIDEAEDALNSTKDQIYQIEQKQDQLQEEIDALDAELVQVIINLGVLEVDLANAQTRLEEVQADYRQAQKEEKDQYEAMKKRIKFMYERGDKAFLISILESKSITELLNRVEYVNEVYDYDRTLLTTYQEVRQQVADLEIQVQSEIAELEAMQVIYADEQQNYETMIAQKQSQMNDFDNKLAYAKELAAEFQKTIEEQNEIIRQEEERRRREEEERRRREEEERKRREEEERKRREEEERKRREEEEKKNNSSNGESNGEGSNGSDGGGNNNSGGGGKNPSYSTNISGSDVVNYACQFIGNPYVYGGTDINNGIDCSAFVRYVYRHFGIELPRTSYQQRWVGQEVSYANAQPGDIICYSGHVAIYMGDGAIVHASNSNPYPAGGIKVSSNAAYRTILSVRRVL